MHHRGISGGKRGTLAGCEHCPHRVARFTVLRREFERLPQLKLGVVRLPQLEQRACEIAEEARVGGLFVDRLLEVERCESPILSTCGHAPQPVFAVSDKLALDDRRVFLLCVVERTHRQPGIAAKPARRLARPVKPLELIEMRQRGIEFSMLDQLTDH